MLYVALQNLPSACLLFQILLYHFPMLHHYRNKHGIHSHICMLSCMLSPYLKHSFSPFWPSETPRTIQSISTEPSGLTFLNSSWQKFSFDFVAKELARFTLHYSHLCLSSLQILKLQAVGDHVLFVFELPEQCTLLRWLVIHKCLLDGIISLAFNIKTFLCLCIAHQTRRDDLQNFK